MAAFLIVPRDGAQVESGTDCIYRKGKESIKKKTNKLNK